MEETPEQFVKKTMLSSFYLTTGIMLLIGAIIIKAKTFIYLLLLLTPAVFITFFFYFIKLPDARIMRHRREINQEIIYAGRFLVVELKSGVLLYDALKNVSKSFKSIGKYFDEITASVDMGTDLEDALVEAIDYTPSEDLRRILWQVLNALNTGADVAQSISAVVDQITKRQAIEMNQYAKTLNPIAMFYMLIAVILPSLGIALLVVLSSFFPIQLDATILVLLALTLGLMQLSFIAIIKSTRPEVGM